MYLCAMVDGENSMRPSDLPVPHYVSILSDASTLVSDWRYVATTFNNPTVTKSLLGADRFSGGGERLEFNAAESVVTFSSLVDGKDGLFQVENDSNTLVSIKFPMIRQEMEYVRRAFTRGEPDRGEPDRLV